MSASTPPAPPRIAGFGYVRPLGSGGFADVYQYEQDLPRRIVAVKVLRNRILEQRDRSDFDAEADTMARLSNHPSIVAMYQAGVSTDGYPYLTMEYCPGSMRERTRNNPAALQTVLDAGVRLAGALETAHRSGVLHRDIKPSNVLLTAAGRPALTDFGISTLSGRETSEEKTRALSIPWAAPEVLSGDTAGTVASEIWSLAATLYTFAAGISPFEMVDRAQNTQSKMTARITQAKYRPIPGAQGYEPFDAVLARAMAARPEQRFRSMAEFGEALRELQRGYGFDPTPFDVIDAEWVAPAADTTQPRGPVISAVRDTSRAQQRAARDAAQLPVDRDGVIVDRRKGSIRAGLIGAGAAIVVLLIAVGIGMATGLLG